MPHPRRESVSSKAEWLFLAVLFVIAIVTTVVFPPTNGVEGTDGGGFGRVVEASATSD